MTIQNSTVRGWAYATRSDLHKPAPPVVAEAYRKQFMNAEPSVAPAPKIPSHIQVRQIIIEAVKQGPCQMPVTIAQQGRPRRLHVGYAPGDDGKQGHVTDKAGVRRHRGCY
jgi:hypothetical protein